MSDRYQRHSLIDWFDQRTLRQSAVVVVGAGAVGNEVLKNLCLLGIGKILVLDFDTIEEHNLTRTVLFRPADIGKGKAQVTVQACAALNPDVTLVHRHGDFWQTLSLNELKEYRAVLCCVDNHEARIRLNQLCMIAQVDLVNGGINSRQVSVQVFPFGSQLGGACYECWLPPTVYGSMRKRYSCGWLKKMAYQEKKVPTTAITASVAGAQMVSLLLQKLCAHVNRVTSASHFTFDTISQHSGYAVITKSELCPACAAFSHPKRVYRVRRQGQGIPSQTSGIGAQLIGLSEAVVVSIQCDGGRAHEQILDLAEKFDERLAECPTCLATSRKVRIVEELEIGELASLFRNRPLPTKFIHFEQDGMRTILELED